MKYTINVQGVCDYNGKFIDAHIRWPGGTHDAKVFSYGSINKHLQESHMYVELYYLAETRLVCHCLGILLILSYLM